jgi:hypothetical protein
VGVQVFALAISGLRGTVYTVPETEVVWMAGGGLSPSSTALRAKRSPSSTALRAKRSPSSTALRAKAKPLFTALRAGYTSGVALSDPPKALAL